MSGRQAKIILKAVEYLARLRKYDPTLISGGDWREWFMQSAWRSQRDLLTNRHLLISHFSVFAPDLFVDVRLAACIVSL